MITRRTVLSATGAAVAASAVGAHVADADTTIAVDPAADYGIWEGWAPHSPGGPTSSATATTSPTCSSPPVPCRTGARRCRDSG